MYSLQFTNPAARIFKKLPPDVRAELIRQAETLKQAPMTGEQLKGKYRFLRSLHLSYKGVAYRIIYQVVSQTDTIAIFLADKRENIYRRLEHMGL